MGEASIFLRLVSQTADSKGFDSARKKLEAAGCMLMPLALPDPEELNAEEAARQFPGEVKGLFFLDEPLAYVEKVVTRLRGLPGGFRFMPVFYGASSAKILAVVEKQAPFFINEFFLLSDPPERLRYRLVLRQREAIERASVNKAAQEQSSQLAKIDTVLKQREEFLGVCAHDLRSPLALIQTCLQMTLKAGPEAGLTPNYAELLARAYRQSGHALMLVKDLLDVMALEQGLKPQYQMLKLNDFLSQFHADYKVQAQQKNIQFHYSNPVPNWEVLADSERMFQLLQNLFANALKFSDGGTNIYLNVAPFQGRRKNDPPHPMILISLRDEGKGIPQSEMQKIFDRFAQIKEHSREGGRGLGLTVAKQISTLHDGNIWVESEEGHGSTFYVLFPHTVSRQDLPRQNGPVKKVLVAESSEQRRNENFQRLTDWGYSVEFAKDGVEAITRLFHSSPDLIVLTPDLAKIPSAEVANMLKTHPRANAVPILYALNSKVSGKKTDGVLADALLSTPFEKKDWEEALAAIAPFFSKVA
ncbi:hypothetical protein K2X33_08990 [bacterium]|nr:hypothetical protein [bacterium]